jgi:hypothetical protein
MSTATTARVGFQNQMNMQQAMPTTSFLFRDVNSVQNYNNNNQQQQQQQQQLVNNSMVRPLHNNGYLKGKSVNNFEPRMEVNNVNGMKRKTRSSPSNDDMNPAKCLKVNTNSPQQQQQYLSVNKPQNHVQQQFLPRDEVITPGSATNIDIQHFDRLAIDLVEAETPGGNRNSNSNSSINTTASTLNTSQTIIGSHSPQVEERRNSLSGLLDDSYDGYDWLGNGPSTQFFPLSLLHTSPRSPFESDDEDVPEVERLRRENEELKKKLAAVSQIAIDTILNQPKVSEVGMTSDQLKQSRKEAVAAVAAACGISKSRAQKEAKRRWLEGKDNEDLVHHYKVTTNNKTKRTIIGILKKRNEIDLVKDLKKDLKKKELDA